MAQVTRRYAMNANMIFKWLRDSRYAPDSDAVEEQAVDETPCFLPAETVDRPQTKDMAPPTDAKSAQSAIEMDIAGASLADHRWLRPRGTDPSDPGTLST
ncbi:hypothetical protein Q4539_18135 [Yoonia sp. 1_MG-2023]|nr:hypothetical protein [Yoonia sp. 1_MG-2023]